MRRKAKRQLLNRSIHIKLTDREYNEIKKLASENCRSRSGQVRVMLKNSMELTLP